MKKMAKKNEECKMQIDLVNITINHNCTSPNIVLTLEKMHGKQNKAEP